MRWTLQFAATLVVALGGALLLSQPAIAAESGAGTQDDINIQAMSPMQMLEFSDDAGEEISQGLRSVLKMVQQAQKEKDVLLLDCLNEKVAGLKPLAKVAGDVDISLQEAMAKENMDQMVHEMKRLVLAREQARMLVIEAEACVPGTGGDYSGTGRWQSNVPEEGEDEDMYHADPGGVEMPPDASPWN